MHCRPTALLLIAAALAAPPAAASLAAQEAVDAQEAAGAREAADVRDQEAIVSHDPGALPWEDYGDGMRYAALYGDPGAEGEPFVFRLEVQPGFELRPHTHPIAEHLTVLSGRFHVGMGEEMDREAGRAYGPGSYIAIAAGAPAYMWAEEVTVVQVHGVGPLRTDFVEPPPK